MIKENYLWVEKYRPVSLDQMILPAELRKIFKDIVKSGHIGDFIFNGPAGIGKTTAILALARELNYDTLILNGSEEANMDALRNKIKPFASTISMTSSRKLVILDEADGINSTVQPALRNLIESFSKNCSFVLTCNFLNKIIPPLHSRCPVIEFRIDTKQKKEITIAFYKRVSEILEAEKVKYDKKVVAELISRYFPDFRRVLGELQKYSLAGEIDAGILGQFADIKLADLVKYMKDKNFAKMSEWCALNSNNDSQRLFREIYDGFQPSMKKDSIPQFILTLADYLFKSAFTVDAEINLRACLTEVMSQCEWE